MRAMSVVIAAAIAVAAAMPAEAAKKKAQEPAVDPKMASNEQSARLVRDSLPMWLPGWAQAIYFSNPENKNPAPKGKQK